MTDDIACTHCGSKVTTLLCAYCGTPSRATLSLEEEMSAVRELRELLQAADRKRKIDLLETGFVPSQPDAVVEAALVILPLLDDGSADELSNTAFRRVDALVTRLRVTPPSSPRALPELEARLARYRKADRNTGIMALVMVLAVIGLVAWGIHALLHR